MGRRKKSHDIKSDKEILSQESSVEKEQTFAEAEGLPANQKAKKVAKEKTKQKVFQGVNAFFYSSIGDKVMKYIVKGNGCYQVYLGNKAKHADVFKTMLAKWKKENTWVEPHLVQKKQKELLKECIVELQSKGFKVAAPVYTQEQLQE